MHNNLHVLNTGEKKTERRKSWHEHVARTNSWRAAT